MKLTCPICGTPYTEDLFCPHCYYQLDMQKRTVNVRDDAPRSIHESFILLEEIIEKKWFFVFGKHQLFDEQFRRYECICIANEDAHIGKYADIHMGVLIAVENNPSLFYKMHILNGVRMCLTQNPTIPTGMTSCDLMVIWASLDRTELPFYWENAISAYVQPTWLDTAEALLRYRYTSFYHMSDSEILYSVISCDKTTICTNFRSYNDVIQQLKAYIVTQAKSCTMDNYTPLKEDCEVNAFLVGDKFKRAAKAVIEASPEMLTSSNGEDWNNYLFMLRSCETLASPLLSEIKDEKSLIRLEETSHFFRRLWEAYGARNSQASYKHYADNYANCVGAVAGNATEQVMTYWNYISKKLEDALK